MAQEDVLPQLLAELMLKANPDPPSDNQQLNKIEVPNDIISVSVNVQTYLNPASITQNIAETMTISTSTSTSVNDPTTFAWGGIDSNGVLQYGGWDWGVGGAWG